MASSTRGLVPWVLAPLWVTACFNPSPSNPLTDSDGGCSPGTTQDCACEDGAPGAQTCGEDGTFGTCECADASTDTVPGDTTTTGPDPTADSSSGEPPECAVAEDCTDEVGECEAVTCEGGMCVVGNAEAGTPCGDATDEPCNDPDTCDGRGTCVDNVIPDGAICDDCPADVCICNAGACEACNTFAPSNGFATPRGIDGWELTGDWSLRASIPQSFANPGGPFSSQVLGTDGNRLAPYPGAQTESSYARTGVTTLPASLDFVSWHVDEGGVQNMFGQSFDNKRIRISTDDGMTWTTVADCSDMTLPPPPFCTPRLGMRAPDDWDPVSISVPPPMVGQPGIVEFSYDSMDDCCGQEQGWFIDSLNFATECACAFDDACEAFGGECGAAICGGMGSCQVMAEAADTPCGDPASSACNGADRCNATGQCLPFEVPAYINGCADCPSGTCSVCEAGVCNDCDAGVNDFAGPIAIAGWTIEDLAPPEPAGWGLYSVIPRQQFDPVMASLLSTAPVLGVDGNRVEPYPGGHEEASRITSPTDMLPATLTFDSWHQDEGGNSGSMYDNKIIEVSIDGGMTWNVIVDCSTEDPVMPAHPFCGYLQGPRAMDDWDPIALDLGPFGGQMGQLRLSYMTQDTCCNFERGWYLDNLNFAQFCD